MGAKPAYAFRPRAANLDEQVRFARLTKSCIPELEDSAARALAAACPPLSRLAVPDLPSDLHHLAGVRERGSRLDGDDLAKGPVIN